AFWPCFRLSMSNHNQIKRGDADRVLPLITIGGETVRAGDGYEGQYTVCVPSLDLIMVRHGKSEAGPKGDAVRAWLAQMAEAFRS
ncbi:MAG: hypothetical protein AAGF15_12025, partial [Pseudomonadota bacterium]